jgi:hypothetical protein
LSGERIHHDASRRFSSNARERFQKVFAFGIAHRPKGRKGRIAEVRLQAREYRADRAGLLARQASASQDGSDLVFASCGELAKRREPGSQARVSSLVQFFICLQAAQDKEQLAQWVRLVTMGKIPVAIRQRARNRLHVWKITTAFPSHPAHFIARLRKHCNAPARWNAMTHGTPLQVILNFAERDISSGNTYSSGTD